MATAPRSLSSHLKACGCVLPVVRTAFIAITEHTLSAAAQGGWTPSNSPSRPGGASLLNMAVASAAAMPSPPSNLPSPSTPRHARPPLSTSTHRPSLDSSPGPNPDPSLDPPGPYGVSALSLAESQLSAELLAQSISAAAPRLLLRNFSLAKVKLLIDLHVADPGPNIPFGLDTHR